MCTKNKMKKVKIILGALLLLLLTGCGEQKVNLSEYVDVTYQGLNGRATATVDMKFAELEDLLWNNEDSEMINFNRVITIEESIGVSIDKTENVSNGDKLLATITWDKELAKKHKLKFTGETKEITVAGLEEGKVVDLFSDVRIEYSGVSPNAQATVVNNSKDNYISGIRYELEKNTIANGDELKVVAYCDPKMAENQGYLVGDTEKIYIAEGIDEYVKSYSQIDEETLNKMNTESRDAIESALASDQYTYSRYTHPEEWGYASDLDMDTVEVSDIKLAYTYFLTLKDGLSKELYNPEFNCVFQVYQVTTKDNLTPEGAMVYIPVKYKNFIARDTGKIDVVITDSTTSSNIRYTDFDNMYRETVTANKDKYTYEEIKH